MLWLLISSDIVAYKHYQSFAAGKSKFAMFFNLTSVGMSGAPGMVEVEEVEETEEEEDKGPSPNPVLKFILGKELANSNRWVEHTRGIQGSPETQHIRAFQASHSLEPN